MAETIGYLILAGIDYAATAAAGVGGSAAASGTVAAAVGGTAILPGLTVAGAVGTAAILTTSTAITFATAAAPKVPDGSDGSQPLRQPVPPRPFGYGRTRLAGSYMLFELQFENSWDVLALHHGRIAGVVDIPNACVSVAIPTEMFEFDIKPNSAGPKKHVDSAKTDLARAR